MGFNERNRNAFATSAGECTWDH